MRAHRFDALTGYCLQCSASEWQVVDGQRLECVEGVIAAAHIFARKSFARALNLKTYCMEDNIPPYVPSH